MAQQHEHHLNAEELAALDVMIAAKRHDPSAFNELANFIGGITALITRAVPVVVRATPGVAQITAQLTPQIIGAGGRGESLGGLGSGGKLSLEDLLEARKQAAGK